MALRQAAFRFYLEDGTEATSTGLAAQNTSISKEDGDQGTFLIRFLIQSDASTVGSNTVAQFQRNLNGGAWANITTSSTIVKAVTTSVFADAANTTSLLGGSGTFETSSSGCTHDGTAGGSAFDIVANGRGETVCSVQLIAAAVVPGDVVGIRISTTPTAITVYDQNATVTITTPSPAITSIDGDNDTTDTRTGVVIAGANFGASETGSAKVEISNNAVYASGIIVEIDATSWSAASITVTLRRESDSVALATLLSLPLSPAYLWVTDSAGLRNASGFQCTLRPPGPTPVAAVNTGAALNVDTTYLARVRVENSGGAGATGFKWQVNHASGGYVDITAASSNVRAVAAASFANNDDVPQVIGGSGTYASNNDAATEDGTTTLAAAFPAGGAIEYVLSFQLRSADVSNGQTGLMRLVLDTGTALDTYTQTPQYSVVEGAAAVGMVFPPPMRRFQHMLVR